MAATGLDQIKVHLSKDLKAKFLAKVKREGKSQTGAVTSLIHKYLNEKTDL